MKKIELLNDNDLTLISNKQSSQESIINTLSSQSLELRKSIYKIEEEFKNISSVVSSIKTDDIYSKINAIEDKISKIIGE